MAALRDTTIATFKTIAGALVALLLFSGSAAAATRTYIGSVPTLSDVRWSTSTNWREGVAPVNGDRVVIEAQSRESQLQIDLPNLQLESIEFRPGFGSYDLYGHGITLTSNNPVRVTAPLQVRFNVPVRLTSPSARMEHTASGNEPLPVLSFQDLQLAGGTLTIFGPGAAVGWYRVTESASSSIDVTARIVSLGADTAITGTLTVAAIEIGAWTGSFGSTSGATTIRSNSGPLAMVEGGAVAESIVLRGTGDGAGVRGRDNVFSGSISLAGPQVVSRATFQGPIGGTGKLIVGDALGIGMVTLGNAANAFSGGVEVRRDLRLVGAEVIPDSSELVLVDGPMSSVEIGPFTETVRRFDCIDHSELRWTPGAMLRVLEPSRIADCDLELTIPTGYSPPAEITLIRNDSGVPLSGRFHDLPQDRSVTLNGVERFMSYVAGPSRRDVALVTKSVVANIDVLVPLMTQAITGQVISQPGAIQSRDASGNLIANALFRVGVDEGCGTFAGGTHLIDLISNASGVVTLPAFHATGFNRACSVSVLASPAGRAIGSSLTVYDPETLEVVIETPFATLAPGGKFFARARVMAGGREGVPVGGIPTLWEVSNLSGGASATFDGDVIPDNSTEDVGHLTGNADTGVYQVRVSAVNSTGTMKVTQTHASRVRAVGPGPDTLSILDGGTECGFSQSNYQPNPQPRPIPGWGLLSLYRVTLTGCTSAVKLRLWVNGENNNGVVMRFGPVVGDETPRWREVVGTLRDRGYDFVLDDGVDDDDLVRNGSITAYFGYAVPSPVRQGMWWAGEAENGWGMSIVQHRDTLFSVIYTYDAAGNPIWYVMPGGTWNADHTKYTGSLYVPRGSPYFAYDVNSFVPGSPVGQATLTIGDVSTTALDYTIGGVTGHKTIMPQFLGGYPSVPHVPGDMWWGGEGQNGWGVAVLSDGSTNFSVWFTYDAAGAPTWFVMPGGSWIGSDAYFGTLYRTVGSPWLGRTYDPALLQPIPVGEYSLQFSGIHGRMRYTNEGRSGVLKLLRQPF